MHGPPAAGRCGRSASASAPVVDTDTRPVVVTGGAGRIGGYLRQGLPAEGFTTLRFLDRHPIPGEKDVVVGDIGDPDVLDRAFAGARAVVHLAGAQEPDEATSEFIHSNVEAVVEILEAMRRNRVPRLIFASTNHADGFSPRSAGFRGESIARPDNLYGATKIFGEALARLYWDRYGIRTAAIRIGSCFDRPTTPRMLGTWLSPRDAPRLIAACLMSEDLEFAVIPGISANTRRWWDLAPALALGYRPQEDAEVYAAEVLAATGGIDPSLADDPQGGREAAWISPDRETL